MTRQWRIEFEGAYYHILSRGNEQRNIFTDNDDRISFLEILGNMSERFEIEVYAYVLINNHYHLLLKTNKPNISKGMQWFGTTYTRRYNVKHKRNGHLFQGQFKNFLVENDEYLMSFLLYPQESAASWNSQAISGLYMEQLSSVCLRQKITRVVTYSAYSFSF